MTEIPEKFMTAANDLHLSLLGRPYRQTVEGLARALMAADEAATKRAGWQPIETAPKDGTPLLLVVAGYEPAVGRFYPDLDEWSYQDQELFDALSGEGGCFGSWNPTHWMPLPPPPAVNGDA